MQYCDSCNVRVSGNKTTCPLCGGVLHGKATQPPFPVLKKPRFSKMFVTQVISVIAVSTIALCITANLVFPSNNAWWFFSIIGVVCAWISTVAAIRSNRYNLLRTLTFELFWISLLAIGWDWLTGWHNWSLTYVLPFLCMAMLVAMLILSRVLQIRTEDYLVYWGLNALYGLVPLIFILTGMVQVVIPSALCFVFSFVIGSIILVFQGKNLYQLIARRFHL